MVTGRITLFHCVIDEDNPNPPALKGKIEYPDGTVDQVTLWKTDHPRVTKGEFFTGQLYQSADGD